MKKWGNDIKKEVIKLRNIGWSYPMIVGKLDVPKGTLNGWLRKTILSNEVQAIILDRKRNNLIELRRRAWTAHKNYQNKRRFELETKIRDLTSQKCFSRFENEMLFIGLWLGEGFKIKTSVGLGNSNADILKFFVDLFCKLYVIDGKKFRCFLHLRMDQDDDVEIKYWSKILDIPRGQFRKTYFDKRTLGKKTRIGYHGVCTVIYHDAEIAKHIMMTSKILLELSNDRVQKI
ncbi:MAG: hypothetical protein NT003_00775, partial [Candidatus Magasanikbacteria bacterium]|nr:hypothetical protein [Candidatus Magasanikbacteria bacterium]